MNREEYAATVGQKRGIVKVLFVSSHIEQRCCVSALGRHLHQAAVSRREDNDPVSSPACGSGSAEHVGQIGYRSSSRAGAGHLPHLFSNHISEVGAIGGPERVRRVLSVWNFARFQAIQIADPQPVVTHISDTLCIRRNAVLVIEAAIQRGNLKFHFAEREFGCDRAKQPQAYAAQHERQRNTGNPEQSIPKRRRLVANSHFRRVFRSA